MTQPTSQEVKHTPPGWPKTPYQMLERIEKRWFELQDRDISNHDFACLMSDVSQFVFDYKTFESEMLSALKAAHKLLTQETFNNSDGLIDRCEEVAVQVEAAILKAGAQ